MFHLHTIDGALYNIPLESLEERKEIGKTGKNLPSRKLLSKEQEEAHEADKKPSGGGLTYAEKAYRDAVKIKNEREPIFHAWQIMNSPVKTLTPEMPVTEAWNYFKQEEVSHMPVLSTEKEITGIVSDRDLLKYLIISDTEDTAAIKNWTDKIIEDIMIKEVLTANRMTDIRRIAKVLFDYHIGTMPILNDTNRLIGIITRSDILHALINYPPLKLWA
ncbi:MAG: CBS domain-containing protein [bacterium]|nr:CBS domain-containing protein [bacterium]